MQRGVTGGRGYPFSECRCLPSIHPPSIHPPPLTGSKIPACARHRQMKYARIRPVIIRALARHAEE